MVTSPQHEEDYSWIVWLLMLILTLVGATVGWFLRGKYEDLKEATAKAKTRTIQTQSQTKFTWWCETQRFTPLGDRDQGAWPGC